jgi:hypothetical protein
MNQETFHKLQQEIKGYYESDSPQAIWEVSFEEINKLENPLYSVYIMKIEIPPYSGISTPQFLKIGDWCKDYGLEIWIESKELEHDTASILISLV